MYARVSDLTGPVDQLDRGITDFREQVVPAVRAMEGFVRAYLLVDRENGRTLAVTVWETEDALRGSEEAAARLRSSVAEDISATSTTVSRYEIVVSEPTD